MQYFLQIRFIYKFFIIFFVIITFNSCAETINTTSHSNTGEWNDYYEHTLHASKPHHTLQIAIRNFKIEGKSSGLAVDLGTGTGRDALFLLKNGWHALAIDNEQQALDIVLNRAAQDNLYNLETHLSSFADMILPDDIDLVNASLSLPFCPTKAFPTCWKNIIDHLAINGRFAGHFFGEKDEWASKGSLSTFSYEEVLLLFKNDFEIEYFRIEEGSDKTAEGSIKYWHIFHVVAKKVKRERME